MTQNTLEQELIKDILHNEGRIAYLRATQNPFNWDIPAMIAESEARIKAAKELLYDTKHLE